MKIKAVITGPMVQGVGYRVFLMHEAVAQGIERFTALNVSDDTVVVLAEADETTISNFKEFISTRRPEHAQVSEVRIEDFKGRVMTLQEATILNTVEQMNKAIPILVSMDGRMARIDEKMDRMLEKQDETVDQVRGLREDLGTIHAERMERMERDIAEIKAKIGL
ncbi:acylphosphatase [Methanotrichaceae archaeon M04Ac]|uniref:acylphosphatase n=1 Tax=Candidatus Methanocrinis alkalitolerans TaxID=3033395 RepID=A0ABT5XE56_9EURY|nr:acylphosphatase [Candidatus Methanocrinis alkalitolerans]MCR3884756.1 acylphosphatase [Methanothrix sp.]MDF0592988.1 acylphosphatase [Candidatus Methanocrinis alkalitolerans]